MCHRNQPNKSNLEMYKPLLYYKSHLKQLYISNKMEQSNYKDGCGVHGHTCNEAFKSKAALGNRQIALGYWLM